MMQEVKIWTMNLSAGHTPTSWPLPSMFPPPHTLHRKPHKLPFLIQVIGQMSPPQCRWSLSKVSLATDTPSPTSRICFSPWSSLPHTILFHVFILFLSLLTRMEDPCRQEHLSTLSVLNPQGPKQVCCLVGAHQTLADGMIMKSSC